MVKLYPSFTLFFSTLAIGTFLVIRSSNWLMVWIGLELSLLGFLPLIMGTFISREGIVKYFLIQSRASVIFILSFMVQPRDYSSMVFLIRMAIKIGLVPFHQWVPSVIRSLTWPRAWILMTIQKAPPLILILKQSTSFNQSAIALCVLRVLVRGLIGFNQTKMRSLLAYSSIAHTGWTVAASTFSLAATGLYFMLYCSVLSGVTFQMAKIATDNIIKLKIPKAKRFLLSSSMFNLAGIPPFPIFWIKLIVLTFIIKRVLLSSMIILGARITIFFYIYYIIPSAALIPRQEIYVFMITMPPSRKS